MANPAPEAGPLLRAGLFIPRGETPRPPVNLCYNTIPMNKPTIDVAYVAELARLELTEEEKAVFQPQLENIVKYVEKISSVDVDGVPPTLHGREIVNAFREDVVRPSLDREAALANAPARTGDEFMLPKIVEGAES